MRVRRLLSSRRARTPSRRNAWPDGVVLLAGKGHERTMLLAPDPEPWDERAELSWPYASLGWPAGKIEPPPTIRTISTTSPSRSVHAA